METTFSNHNYCNSLRLSAIPCDSLRLYGNQALIHMWFVASPVYIRSYKLVVWIYLHKYLFTCSMLLIALTPSILWELENRLVVGTNFSFRTPRANPLAKNLAQWETMHVSAKVCLQFFIDPLVWILDRAELQRGTKIMMPFFGMPLRVN